jgi:hypothetical protein
VKITNLKRQEIMFQQIPPPPIRPRNVTIKITKPRKIALVGHLVDSVSSEWSKERIKAEIIMLLRQSIFFTLNEKQIKRQIKLYIQILFCWVHLSDTKWSRK